jgi:hypothetical protein
MSGEESIMPSASQRILRIAALVGSGAVLLQTGPCLVNAVSDTLFAILITSIFGVMQLIFRNLLNL